MSSHKEAVDCIRKENSSPGRHGDPLFLIILEIIMTDISACSGETGPVLKQVQTPPYPHRKLRMGQGCTGGFEILTK
jgi:hypothetical protein